MYSGWELSAVVGSHGYEVPVWQTQRSFHCSSVLSLQKLKLYYLGVRGLRLGWGHLVPQIW